MPNGITQYTQKPMISGTPNDSAIQALKNQQTTQANNNRLMAGGKYKINKKITRKQHLKKRSSKSLKKRKVSLKKKRYTGGAIVVAQPPLLYQPQGGQNQNPHALMVQNARIQSQGSANAEYDKKAFNGGRKSSKRKSKSKRGGNKGWGCMSGG